MISFFIITSVATYFITTFHIYIDHSMIENVLSSDYREASELLQLRIIPYVFFLGIIPAIIIYRVKIESRKLLPSLIYRIGSIICALSLTVISLWIMFQDFGPVFHEKQQMRYLITPFNYIISSIDVYRRNHQNRPDQKIKVGEDAAVAAFRSPTSKPRLIILVVGETVRASNWGLNGYKRQTTPQLAKHQLINFNQVTSCGTTTAISVPCMFSPYGKHAYNQNLINSSQSLLHVLQQAKISVLWRDNQSGCKGVCDDLPFEHTSLYGNCGKKGCLDSILLYRLKEKIDKTKDQLIVLHMLGNHGPAYFERYPKQFKHWKPTCDTADLVQCSKKSIINTYDNVILYTDDILARAIEILSTVASHDTGLIYLSDHGESLGEYNLFLHGLPYNIAPEVQKRIPMVIWLSEGLKKQLNLQWSCLKLKQSSSISQDYLFSTVLALFNVTTKVYNKEYDLTYSCRSKYPHNDNV